MERNYDNESVQELLAWAQNILKDKFYPEGRYKLNKSTTILDCGKYLESMISMINRNWENHTFYPAIDQLREFRFKIESNKDKGIG